MQASNSQKAILWLSISLAALVAFASLTGLLTPGFYVKETANWQAQSIGQDIVDLFLVVPALVVSAILAFHNRKGAMLVWAGVLAYLLYTFIIYCFFVHFNKLFIVYCFSLGLSFYSLAWFAYQQTKSGLTTGNFAKVPSHFTGIFFIVIAAFFYFLWLSEIIPALIKNDLPKSAKEGGLPTNPVQVLDISVFLPGIFITGLFLLQKKLAGYIMAPVLLSFFVLMNITIGLLVIVMKQRGIEADYMLTVIMGVLTVICIILLIIYLKKIKHGL